MRNGLGVVLLMAGLVSPAIAATAEGEPGFAPFPGGSVERRSSIEDKEMRVFLGAVSEVNNELRVNDSIRKRWSGFIRTLRVGRSNRVEEVADYYRSRIREKEATVLFECQGRACGNSNVWANRVFDESRLYGRDDAQRYWVTAWPDAKNRIQLNTLYAIERGNREVYVHEQAFRLAEGESLPGVALKERRIFGPVIVPWDNPDSPTMEASAAVFDRILALAEEYEDGSLHLIGFSPLEDGSLDQVMEQTKAATQRLQALLEERGLNADRIRTRVLGPLVRTVEAERSGRRIEVMLIREGNDE
ncbi:uncharacterized protein DUF4892 [Halospina denitrificans]|uniref:Uncharacterized protein DUF4892 n=1 Tax=Halospina denitrificans TaxID=332522 RepID=A0A4R7JTA7_9GAMM|nr:DUF4892 domain-containing protein [Halospina denitrificans]TDT41552.1 uncharacterized protein DUF4892 [Halospina denitrificans]